MTSIVYPNIGAVNDDAKPTAQPTIVINNTIQSPPQPVAQEQPKPEPSREQVDLWGKRLRYTSFGLIAIGGLSAICCVLGGFNARHITEKILSGDHHRGGWWRNHHGGPHQAQEHFKLPDTISREEWAIYDLLRSCAFAGFILSMLIVCSGKRALCATWKQKPEFTQRVIKKTLLRIVLIVLACMYIHHNGKEIKRNVRSFREKHG